MFQYVHYKWRSYGGSAELYTHGVHKQPSQWCTSYNVISFFNSLYIIGKAFCEAHCVKVAELGYPTDLKEFLKSCGNEKQSVDPNEYSKPMKQRVDEELKVIAKLLEGASIDIKSATEAQGTSYLLRNTAFRNKNNFMLQGDGDDCNK